MMGTRPLPGAAQDHLEAPELDVADGEPDGSQERQASDAAGGCDPDCDDNNLCTTDECLLCFGGSCIGACTHTWLPNGTPCNDGVFCNGVDTCSAGVCQHPGNPCLGGPVCNTCCSEAVDSCACVLSICDDGVFCNGPDQCLGGSCSVHPGPLPCFGADGDANCSESCNEFSNNCTGSDPEGAACDDGVSCNGADTCSAGLCSDHDIDCPCAWSALGSGVNNWVNALAVYDNGSGETLYAGGGFTSAGGASANHIARWDGSNWSALGSGINGEVRALAVYDDGGGEALYAAGSFNAAGGESALNVAKWNGSSWLPVNGVSGHPQVLEVVDVGFGPELYLGGSYSFVVDSAYVWHWDNSSWQGVGSSLGTNQFVFAITGYDDGLGPDLYAGGDFDNPAADYIAKLVGSNWSEPGSGTNGAVEALTVFDDGGGPDLYAGGEFTFSGGGPTVGIAKWDGFSWSAVGYGSALNGVVLALAVFDDGGEALYAGGEFTTAGGNIANRIARWNGSSWSPLESGMNAWVGALTVFDDGGGPDLYAAGDFTTAGGAGANRIAKWACSPPCSIAADCADANGNGIRDNNCVWSSCDGDTCSGINIVFADMGGSFGACQPDGTADANDRFHALNCFSNVNTTGTPGYPCEDSPPQAYNVDAGGSFGDCDPDGVCDGNDAFHAVNAFQGSTTCSCSGPMPTAPQPPTVVAEASIRLQAHRPVVRPGETVEVDVFLVDPVADLRGYQLHAGVRGGDAGTLELVDIVAHDRKDEVFAGLADWQAFNIQTRQMVAGLDGAGVETQPSAYLTTFVFEASPDAGGTFTIDLLHDDTDPRQRTFLFTTAPGAKIAVQAAQPAVVTVQPKRSRAW
jgi:hypothetical protein